MSWESGSEAVREAQGEGVRSRIDNRKINLNNRRVNSSDPQIPKIALVVMLIIVVAFALVAVYANVQRLRRDKIESVTVTPAASQSATASP